MNGKHKNITGLTMIEVAILLTVSGLILSVVAQYYTSYRQTYVIQENIGRMKQIVTSIDLHNNKHGFYPCPAPRTVDGNNTAFGKSFCPAAGTLNFGDCTLSGICRVRTANNRAALIGALPFKDLNMTVNLSMNDFLDTFQNQYTYVMMEEFKDAGYDEDNADITRTVVTYNDGSGRLETNDFPDQPFALISHGANGVGAYNLQGRLVAPCDLGTAEGENCDDGDAVFLVLQRKRSESGETDYDTAGIASRGTVEGSASMYDDFIEFSASSGGSNHWSKEANRGLKSLNGGLIGIGTREPLAKLHISDPVTPMPTTPDANFLSEQVHTNEICEHNSTDCFDPDVIAGDGITCNNSPMIGITEGAAICSERGVLLGVTAQNCPANQYIHSIDATGAIHCAEYLP